MRLFILLTLIGSFIFANGPVEEMYNGKYQKLRKNKALYVAIDHETGAWAAGMSGNDGSIVGAKRVARRYCLKYVKQNNVNAECKVYAINDKIVGSVD